MVSLKKYSTFFSSVFNITECFFDVTKLTTSICDENNKIIKAYTTQTDLINMYSPELFESFLHEINFPIKKNNNEIIIFGDMSFIINGIYEDNLYRGFVIVGPILSSNPMNVSHEIYVDTTNKMKISKINNNFVTYMEDISKLLSRLLNNNTHINACTTSSKRTSFNPYNLAQYFSDSIDYMSNEIEPTRNIDFDEVYQRLIFNVVQNNKAEVKKVLNSMLDIELPTPHSKTSHIFSDLRIRKNIMLSLFSLINYTMLEQKICSDFYTFFSSVIMTELELTKNETELRITVNDLCDRLFDRISIDNSEINLQIRSAMFYITNHLEQKLTLEEVANHLSLNPKYLSRLFYKETKIPFKAYVSNQKIKYAKNLLRYTRNSISEIALSIGIESTNNFASFFKKHTNTTPTQYRQYK